MARWSDSPRWLGPALGAALVALAASVGLQDVRAFDYWWHLRTGELIWETGAVPRVDPYTYTVPGNRWIDIHWLHQLGLYGLHSLGGHAAVVVAKAVMVIGLVAILGIIGWRRQRPVVTACGLGLMLLVAADRIMPRPELPTFLLLAGVLALLDRFVRRGDAWIYAVVAIQLIWVNVHGLFALGLAVLAIHLAAEGIEPLLQPGTRLRLPRIRRLAAVTALSALVTCVNPNLLEGALYPIQQLGMIGPPEERGVFGSLIAELLPPLGGRPGSPLAVGLFAAMAAASLAAIVLNWRGTRGADPLLWVAFLYLALGAQRNLALFAVVAAPLFVRNLNEFLDARPVSPRALQTAGIAVFAALVILCADVVRGNFFLRMGSYREAGFGVFDIFYPVGAAEWIARQRPPGPICHHMADGGYLIWRLYPDYRVMVDGRLEVFGPERFVELQVFEPHRFRALDQEFRFGTVLVHYSLIESSELLRWLHLNSNWQLTFVDETAALFVRRPERKAPLWHEVDVDAEDLFAPLADDPGLRDRFRRQAQTSFLMALGRDQRALRLWEATLERYPDLPQGQLVHASLLRRVGFPAAAEVVLRKLLADRPRDALLHARVGDLRLEAGDPAAAAALYRRALDLDPDLAYALLRSGFLAESEGDRDAALELYARVIATAHPADPVAIQAGLRVAVLLGRR